MLGGEILDVLMRAGTVYAYAGTVPSAYDVAMHAGLSEPASLVIGALALAMLKTLISAVDLVVEVSRRKS
jgi:hypothetical protein